ncbi:FHA domain-containing protein [Streptomyces polyrhachis]|uniref:FHA domain-containing protein n=1 Tax=Streptomyces polyrhachis TaxID=1282885 RepID=A0ABW2GM54_9ACTN
MATCQNGHTSATEDWCEVCGIRMASGAGAPVPPPPGSGYGFPGGPEAAQPPRHTELCPQCRTPREALAPFCEECRYNFLTHSPTTFVPTGPPPGANGGAGGYPGQQGGQYPGHQGGGYAPQHQQHQQHQQQPEPQHSSFSGQPDPRSPGGAGDFLLSPPPAAGGYPPDPYARDPYAQDPYAQAPPGWVAVVAPDREYFTAMMSRSGPDASGLNLPAYSPEQQLPLRGPQVTIGRRRQSTGESPDIDLARAPEDPGVSHNHAMLVEQPDGSWAVVDQNSTNGTTVNGEADPIPPYVPVRLQEGDRVHVGAWTTIRIQRG